MARCRCSALACSCVLQAGTGIDIEGNGDRDNPYVISGEPLSTATIGVADTPSLDLSLTGEGTSAAPYVITGHAIIGALIDLVDDGGIIFDVTGSGTEGDPLRVTARLACLDCGEATTTGQVPIWNTALARYVPGAAPTAPFGALVVEEGLSGTGLAAAPLRLDICSYDDLVAACETP